MSDRTVSKIPVKDFNDGHGMIQIILKGPIGCGKTILARIIGGHLEDLGARVGYSDPSDALDPKRTRFDSEGMRGDFYDRVLISTQLTESDKIACHACMGIGIVGNMNTGEMEGCGVCKGTGKVDRPHGGSEGSLPDDAMPLG